MCDSFHTVGVCPYGNRCHFVHNDIEALRPRESEPAAKALPLRKTVTLGSLQSQDEFSYGLVILATRDTPKVGRLHYAQMLNSYWTMSNLALHYWWRASKTAHLERPSFGVSTVFSTIISCFILGLTLNGPRLTLQIRCQ